MAVVESYAYRMPRFEIGFPVEFCLPVGTIAGHTKNVSDTGLLVRFAEPLLNGTSGVVRLRFGTSSFEIEALVTHTEFLDAGLTFVFASEQERQFVRTLVKVLAKTIR